ncbi:O-antigen ligase family protein [Arthrobacter sp. CP30]
MTTLHASELDQAGPNATAPAVASTARSRVSALVLGASWTVLFVNVQPWSASGPLGGGDGSAELKGAVILATLVMLMLVVPPRSKVRVPAAAGVLLAYGVYVFLVGLAQAEEIGALLRSVRYLAGILVVVILGVLVRDRSGRVLAAGVAAFGLLGLSVAAGFASGGGQWLDGKPYSAGGRLAGGLLPMMPPRVGEIGAILVGLTLILAFAGKMRWWVASPSVVLGLSLLLLSRTRTAALGLVAGLLVAFLLTAGHRLGRRGLVALLAAAALCVPFLSPVTAWVIRGQEPELIGRLSGRTAVWEYILSRDLDLRVFLLGHGLGEKRVSLRRGEGDIASVPIDNSWLSLFWEVGLVGVVLVLAAVLAALYSAIRTTNALARAGSMFLLVYVMIASVNESGLSDLSSLTLVLLLAVCVSSSASPPRPRVDAVQLRTPSQKRFQP